LPFSIITLYFAHVVPMLGLAQSSWYCS